MRSHPLTSNEDLSAGTVNAVPDGVHDARRSYAGAYPSSQTVSKVREAGREYPKVTALASGAVAVE